MKKYITALTGCLLILLTTIAPWMSAAALPNNVYFRPFSELQSYPGIPDLANPRYVLTDFLSWLGLSDADNKTHLYQVYKTDPISPDIHLAVFEMDRTTYSYPVTKDGVSCIGIDYCVRYCSNMIFRVQNGEFQLVEGGSGLLTASNQLLCRNEDGLSFYVFEGKQNSNRVYTYFMFCDNPGFVFPDECEHKSQYDPEEENLNVSVSIDPELTGTFSRKGSTTNIETGFKHEYEYSNLNLKVTNNSNFPIQFSFYIVEKGNEFSVDCTSVNETVGASKTFSGNPSYVFVTDEWNYIPTDNQNYSGGVLKSLNPCVWHYVEAHGYRYYPIDFSHMKLTNYTDYTVYVYAIRNDLGDVSSIGYNRWAFSRYSISDQYYMHFEESTLVYTSEFTNVEATKFDPKTNDLVFSFDPDGNDPFCDDLMFRRSVAYVDENGNEVIGQKDTYTNLTNTSDPAFSFTQGLNSGVSNAWYPTSSGYSGSSSSNVSSIVAVSTNISSYLSFVSEVFKKFPIEYKTVVSLGLTSLVVLGILNKLFGR